MLTEVNLMRSATHNRARQDTHLQRDDEREVGPLGPDAVAMVHRTFLQQGVVSFLASGRIDKITGVMDDAFVKPRNPSGATSAICSRQSRSIRPDTRSVVRKDAAEGEARADGGGARRSTRA